MEKQIGQECLILPASNRERPPALKDLERTEDAELHASGDERNTANYAAFGRRVGAVWAPHDRAALL